MSSVATFLEMCELLAHIPADSETTEVNTGWLFVGNFHEIVVLISVGDIAASGTLDVDIEDDTDGQGSSVGTITAKSITQLTATDDDKAILISITGEDLNSDAKQYIRVEVIPAVAASEFSVMVLGYRPRFAPAATTNWHETK